MTTPVIDYTNKDYASLRQAMLSLARYRLPEWTDHSPNDLGVLLVDMFAYMGDIILYYQDRIANESFLSTAVERRSVLHQLRLIGYELQSPVAATAALNLIFAVPEAGDPTVVTVPSGASFAATAADGSSLEFAYLGPDLTIDLGSDQVTAEDSGLVYVGLAVRHATFVSEEILGSSDGEPNQMFRLAQAPVIGDTVVLEVDEGAGFTQWERRDSLLYHVDDEGRMVLSSAEDRAYYLQFDDVSDAWVVFGDGVYARRPPAGRNNIRASYWTGGGAIGNVPAGAIASANTDIEGLESVTNPQPAAGGSEQESTEHAATFGPQVFRSGQRAVTLADYVALAHEAGGVAKVRAKSVPPNRVQLFVAPEGDSCRPVPDDLKKRLIAYFEDRRMVGTIVEIHDSVCVPIDLSLEVVAEHHYDPEVVRLDVEKTIGDLLAFANVRFADILYLSKVYEAIEALQGVRAVTVTQFRRQGETAVEVQAVLDELGASSIEELPASVQNILPMDIVPQGRIDLGDFEIPALGALGLTIREAEE